MQNLLSAFAGCAAFERYDRIGWVADHRHGAREGRLDRPFYGVEILANERGAGHGNAEHRVQDISNCVHLLFAACVSKGERDGLEDGR